MITFREISPQDANLLLIWRQSKRVTNFMRSNIEHGMDEQIKWIQSCYTKADYYHWIIQYQRVDVGFLNFSNWDKQQKSVEWGFYIGEEDALGIGSIIPPYFYNFAFDVLNVERIYADVLENNHMVAKLHFSQGYIEDRSRNSVFIKNGRSTGSIGLVLTKETFKKSKFARLKQEFPLLNWESSPNAF